MFQIEDSSGDSQDITGASVTGNSLAFQSGADTILTFTPTTAATVPEIFETSGTIVQDNDPDNVGQRVVVLSLVASTTPNVNVLQRRGGPTAVSTTFPTNPSRVSVYAGGMKLAFSEVRIDTTTASAVARLVVPAAMFDFPAGTIIQVEIL